MSARDAALDDLWGHCEKLGTDELRVLARIADRLVGGATVYGPLTLDTDRRDMRKEASEELLDGCVYLACKSLQADKR